MPGSKLKILYGYHYSNSSTYPDLEKMALQYFERLKNAGFDVEGFCLTLDPPSERLSYKEIDSRWKRGERTLLNMYEALEGKLDGKDIFINGPGIHLHPEFVRQLSATTVFQCFDDPESSWDLSKPVAAAYDICMVGNIAELETYRSWGAKYVEWLPLGIWPEFQDPTMTDQKILNEDRPIDLFLLADRLSPYRKKSMDFLADRFPHAHFYGRGWPRGYLPVGEEVALLRNSKMGLNIHNSTGPINIRTFYLPANGVLQICDNKSNLGKIFELGKEVVGFDSIEEATELVEYFLAHDSERREIAARGFKRAIKDYNQIEIFRREIAFIEKCRAELKPKEQKFECISLRQKEKTHLNRIIYGLLFAAVLLPIKIGKKILRMILPLVGLDPDRLYAWFWRKKRS